MDSADNADDPPAVKITKLWPTPRHITYQSELTFQMESRLEVCLSTIGGGTDPIKMMTVWKAYVEAFEKVETFLSFSFLDPFLDNETIDNSSEEIPYTVSTVPTKLQCTVNDSLLHRPGAYMLKLDLTMTMVANDISALHNAIQTLIQIISISPNKCLPASCIQDWPTFGYRSAEVNISINSTKVPTKETLRHLIEAMAIFKFNKLHLLCCAGRGQSGWQIVPSKSDILGTVALCESFGISVIPGLETSDTSSDYDSKSLNQTYQQFLLCFPDQRYVYIGPRLQAILSKSLGSCEPTKWAWMLPISLHHTVLLIEQTEHTKTSSPNDEIEYISINTDVPKGCLNGKPFLCRLKSVLPKSLGSCSQKILPQLQTLISNASSRPECLGFVVDVSSIGLFVPLTLCLPGLVASAGFAWNLTSQLSSEDLVSQISFSIDRILLRDKNCIIGQLIQDVGALEIDFLDSGNLQSQLYLLIRCPDKVEFDKSSSGSFQKSIRSLNHIQSQLHKVDLSCQQSGEIVTELQIIADLSLLSCKYCETID